MAAAGSSHGIDAIDIAIVEALQENGRIGIAELGRRVGLSQPATSERVKRLEDRGVIVGYGARIDAATLGLGMMAVIRLRTTHQHVRACLTQFAGMPQVIEALRVTGEDCFVLKVIVPDASELETIVDSLARYGSVTTSLVLRAEPPKPIGAALIRMRRPAPGATRHRNTGRSGTR